MRGLRDLILVAGLRDVANDASKAASPHWQAAGVAVQQSVTAFCCVPQFAATAAAVALPSVVLSDAQTCCADAHDA